MIWPEEKRYETVKQAYSARYQQEHHRRNMEKYAEKQSAIQVARKARGWTQKQLAHMVGVSVGTISEWETGRERADWDRLAAVLPELKQKRAELSNSSANV